MYETEFIKKRKLPRRLGGVINKARDRKQLGISWKDTEGIWKAKQGIARKKINISSKGTIPGKARINLQKANKAILQNKLGTAL